MMEFPKQGMMRDFSKEERRKYGFYCNFHEDYKHDTNDYRKLSYFFETLSDEGKLKEYIKDTRG